MENIFLLKSEIILFFLSFFYIIYYLYEKIIIIFNNLKNIIAPDKSHIHEKIEKLKKIDSEKEKETKKEVKKEKKKEKTLNPQNAKKINEILKRVKLNTSKGYFDKAKSLIIEGLAIDKVNKELNLQLAGIYEEEEDFSKAELIYNDLLNAYNNNFEVLKKLGYNLAIQGKYKDSLEVYLKAYNKKKDDIELIEFISDLAYQLKYYKKALKFIKLFLKQHPRNSEKLKMKAFCQETLGEVEKSIETYKKVLELQPYNSQVQEKLKFLEEHL